MILMSRGASMDTWTWLPWTRSTLILMSPSAMSMTPLSPASGRAVRVIFNIMSLGVSEAIASRVFSYK
jgi:hypothetical protein